MKKLVLILIFGAMLVGASTAVAGLPFSYFSGLSCCGARHYGPYVYATSNAGVTNSGRTVCVQERVFPNYPSTNGSFYDSPACGSGAVTHGLNGKSVDQVLCWVNGSSNANLACDETTR